MSQWLPWLDRQGRFSGLRAAAFALVLLPALILAAEAWTGQLGSKPWTRAVHDTGTWAVRLLLITLTVSPLRRILDWGKLLGIRRMLGLSALAYATAHLALYCIDLAFDWGLIVLRDRQALLPDRRHHGAGRPRRARHDLDRRHDPAGWARRTGSACTISSIRSRCSACCISPLQSKIDVTQPVLMSGLFTLLMAYRGPRQAQDHPDSARSGRDGRWQPGSRPRCAKRPGMPSRPAPRPGWCSRPTPTSWPIRSSPRCARATGSRSPGSQSRWGRAVRRPKPRQGRRAQTGAPAGATP